MCSTVLACGENDFQIISVQIFQVKSTKNEQNFLPVTADSQEKLRAKHQQFSQEYIQYIDVYKFNYVQY